jgi:mono/diheme cytochrome c family protein
LGLALLLVAPVVAQDAAEALFEDNCGACHQSGGVGLPGLAPPLVDAQLWAGLGEEAPKYLAGVMLGGLSGTIEAGGQSYIGLVMPTQGELADADLIAIADYVLNDLNQTGLTLDPALLAQTRAAIPSHKTLRDLRKTAF